MVKKAKTKYNKTKKINFNGTQKHIDNGTRYDPDSCPVALSLCSKGFKTVQVTPDYIEVGKYLVIPVPAKIKRFIKSFDRGSNVKPFKYTIIASVPEAT